ncbi:MAG: T9SS type A sorting domain-containing protein [Paludibacteraceae bacterium]|nr:T9SS type A sorting domain-containing protein [Paludibacteraceae bacterium]
MNESAQEDEIRVFDTNGKLVMTKEVEGPLTILPVQNLVSGVYIVKVGERVEKFVK